MSDIDTAIEMFEVSEYSLPPSEADVSVNESDVQSVYSLMTCISDASVYSDVESEAGVEFSSTEGDDGKYYTSSDESEDESFHSVAEELYQTGSVSEYSAGPSETDVSFHANVMLYPQAYITKLEDSEREGIDTPYPNI